MTALVTIAYNEAHRIHEHLTFAAAYCDELVVVVQESDDGTAEIVKDFGAKVIPDICRGFAEASRSLAFANVDNDWVMYLDADEHLDPAGIPLLAPIQDEWDAARVSVYTYVAGELLNPVFDDGRVHQNRQLRLFRKDRVIWGNHLHSRIYPTNTSREFVTQELRVLGVKTAEEQELDNARYLALEGSN